MAYRMGIANGYLDMLFMMYKFLTSAKMVTSIVYTPGNTGTGYMSAEWASDGSGIVDEDWVITFAEDSGGVYFTVSGSSGGYGLQSNIGTIGTPYVSDNGEIGFTIIQGQTSWAAGDTITFSTANGLGETQKWTTNRYNMVYDDAITYNAFNTGSGTIGNPNYDMYAPEETWTLTALNATTFTVVGSVSGAQSNATVGVAYDNGYVSFTISAGTTAWDTDDVITFAVPEEREIMFEAPGNAGTEEIYMGVQTYENTSVSPAVYQWKLNGYTGFNPDTDFTGQPGSIDYPATVSIPRCVFQDREMPYWIVANGRRVMMFYEVDTVYECMYLGFILPYGLPTESPYPLAVGGTTTESSHDYTSENHYHRAFWDGAFYLSSNPLRGQLRVWSGAKWIMFANNGQSADDYRYEGDYSDFGATWPYVHTASFLAGSSSTSDDMWAIMQMPNLDGTFPLYPIIPWCRKGTRNVFGAIDGLFAIPAGSLLNAKDITTIGGSDYYVFPNVFRTAEHSWCALKME